MLKGERFGQYRQGPSGPTYDYIGLSARSWRFSAQGGLGIKEGFII